MRIATRLTAVATAVFLAWSAVNVSAGPLPADPNAIGGADAGRVQPFLGVVGAFSIAANVEYAVFAPGQFDLGPDPSGGTQYVYAYQVYNTGVGANARQISIITEGLSKAADPANPGSLGAGFGAVPGSSTFAGAPPTSTRWDYTGAPLALGTNSTILLFTSPHPPGLQPGSIQGGGLSDTKLLPSPIPEPASFILLAFGAAALLVVRRRMRWV
ncbi:MAG: PEP-CTERM sorting domain-containing protein [Planctomycetia bacterium]|nr:PEP-CTERM sorting domain-containing protein [Planctomycetia bacterium]